MIDKTEEGKELWHSPIYQYAKQLEQQVREEEDRIVYEISEEIGYTVNKDELIKALNYSQEQFGKGYDKGYKRGYLNAVSDFAEKMKQTISEQVGNDGGFSKAFYTGMVEGIRIFLESDITDKPKHEVGCYSCPNVGHIEKPDCDSAYTENARYCNLYNHNIWESEKRKENQDNG